MEQLTPRVWKTSVRYPTASVLELGRRYRNTRSITRRRRLTGYLTTQRKKSRCSQKEQLGGSIPPIQRFRASRRRCTYMTGPIAAHAFFNSRIFQHHRRPATLVQLQAPGHPGVLEHFIGRRPLASCHRPGCFLPACQELLRPALVERF